MITARQLYFLFAVLFAANASGLAGQAPDLNSLPAGTRYCPAPGADNGAFMTAHFGVDAKTGEVRKYTGTVHPDEVEYEPSNEEVVLFVAPPISVENREVPWPTSMPRPAAAPQQPVYASMPAPAPAYAPPPAYAVHTYPAPQPYAAPARAAYAPPPPPAYEPQPHYAPVAAARAYDAPVHAPQTYDSPVHARRPYSEPSFVPAPPPRTHYAPDHAWQPAPEPAAPAYAPPQRRAPAPGYASRPAPPAYTPPPIEYEYEPEPSYPSWEPAPAEEYMVSTHSASRLGFQPITPEKQRSFFRLPRWGSKNPAPSVANGDHDDGEKRPWWKAIWKN